MCSVAPSSVFVFGIIIIAQVTGGNSVHDGYHDAKLKREVTHLPLPHVVKLGYKSQYGDIWACAGGLIDHKKVVTTTSCTKLKPFGGDLNIVQVHDKNFTIAKIESQGEVAVLFLDKPAGFENDPACLSSISSTSSAIAAGWRGLLFDNQLHATTDKELSQNTVTVFEVTNDALKVRLDPGSSCVVDRGGPLQISNKTPGCHCDVIGVLKDWPKCGESGSIGTYVNLASSIDWIKTVK